MNSKSLLLFLSIKIALLSDEWAVMARPVKRWIGDLMMDSKHCVPEYDKQLVPPKHQSLDNCRTRSYYEQCSKYQLANFEYSFDCVCDFESQFEHEYYYIISSAIPKLPVDPNMTNDQLNDRLTKLRNSRGILISSTRVTSPVSPGPCYI